MRISSKIAWKVNARKEKVWNFAKINFVRRNFSTTSCQTVMFRADILSCVPSNNYGYTDVKITYKGEPKDRCRNRVDDL